MNIDKLNEKVNEVKEKIDKLILIRNKIPKLSIKEIQDNMKRSRLVSPPDINTCHNQQFDIDGSFTLDVLIKQLTDWCKDHKINESQTVVSLVEDTTSWQNSDPMLQLSCTIKQTLNEYREEAIEMINEKIQRCNRFIIDYNYEIKQEKFKTDNEYQIYLNLKEKFEK